MATILLVEDDANTRDLYRAILEAAGHDVHEAADGQVGLRTARATEPHLVILDLGLPIMGGDALLARLRALPFGGDMRILIVTGFDPDIALDRIPRDAADGMVLKPVEPRDLTRAVDDCLAGRPVWPDGPPLSTPPSLPLPLPDSGPDLHVRPPAEE